jgi:hypothetical protein
MKSDSRMISDLHLEQYVLGELSAEEARAVRDALLTDESLQARIEEIKRSGGEILSSFPAVRMAPLIDERLRGGPVSPRRFPPVLTFIVPLAAAALAVFSIIGIRGAIIQATGSGRDVTRPKIPPHMLIYRKTADGHEKLTDGSEVRRGDVLQLAYFSGEAKYGVFFSIDGRGVVTFHSPQDYAGQSQFSPELDQQGETLLPFAYELDDAPAFERFFFVWSRSRFDLREIRKAASALSGDPGASRAGSLRIPPGMSVYSLLLKKQG